MTAALRELERSFSVSCGLLRDMHPEILADLEGAHSTHDLPEILEIQVDSRQLSSPIPDLARLERSLTASRQSEPLLDGEPQELRINPTLQVLQVGWTGLSALLEANARAADPPEPGQDTLLIRVHPESRRSEVSPASNDDLLILKIVSEGISLTETAQAFDIPLTGLQRAEIAAKRKGLLVAPTPRVRRQPERLPEAGSPETCRHSAGVFTLQWHVTQACDLHCKHCYDRSERYRLELHQARSILDDLERFCRSKRVRGRISFSGGNPLLHTHFETIYGEAAERGFSLSILGNPAPERRIRSLLALQRPAFYQVSLEGLQEHNDHIRQPGHFQRTMRFLDLLAELGVPSQVMLTLTRENLDQVLPLAEQLRGRTGTFSFNRLSMVGEGAELLLPTTEDYRAFMGDYVQALGDNPVLGLKDNLLSTALVEQGRSSFGGCTGYGCGAAFNFLALLPDGEVHACRKFPSPLGNAFQTSLEAIYDSPGAESYRTPPEACLGCSLVDRCGSCQAIVDSLGLDRTRDRDPHCSFSGAPSVGEAFMPETSRPGAWLGHAAYDRVRP